MDIVATAAHRFGSAPALVTEQKTLTFVEIEKKTSRIASALDRRGIHAGDRIALCMPNSPELVLLLFALLKTGSVAAPLNYRFPAGRRQAMLMNLKPSVLIGPEKLTGALDFPVKFTPEEFLAESGGKMTGQPSSDSASQHLDSSATVIHTSSSAGIPKAALHSFGNHYYSALGSNANIPFGPGDCWLLSLPLFHIGGYALLFRSLAGGGALAVTEPETTLSEALQRFSLTHLSLVPTQLYRLLHDDASTKRLRKTKAILLGGSAVEPAILHETAAAKLPVYLSYGSTEMSSQITTTTGPVNAVTAGKVLPYRELSIGAGDEILVKGPCLFQGYLSEKGHAIETDSSGWFHTGDTGALSPDGELQVTGRMDNMFISGGENIHPEEIERALCMTRGIRRAVVVPVPDQEYGLVPKAFVEAAENAPADDVLREKLSHEIGTLKTPAEIIRVKEWHLLPGAEKIDRGYYKSLGRAHC